MPARTVWGDGFHDDGFAAVARVRDWSTVSCDEWAVLFPGLLGRGVPEHLQRRILVARATETHRLGVDGSQARRRDAPREGDLDRLSALVEVADEMGSGRRPAHSPAKARSLAYIAHVHPGYVWEEERLDAAAGYAAAWLGIVATGRPALMPMAVAECLSHRLGDPGDALVTLAGRDLAVVAQATRRRLAGSDPVVRRRRNAFLRLVGC